MDELNGDAAAADRDTSQLVALRRLVLAVAVLNDLDLEPGDEGVSTSSGRLIGWAAVRAALGGLAPDSADARVVLRSWLGVVQSLGWRSPEDLAQRARPVGLPRGHLLHPGPAWVRHEVLGGALDLGVGFVGIGSDPDVVVVPRAGVLAALGLDDRTWWPACARYLEEMGELATARYLQRPELPLRPMGDCDVATLLGSRSLRVTLCAKDSARMRAAAVPTRNRGWLDLSRIDPAFALAAASLADDEERGFARPLLVTEDGVNLARAGGDAVLQALRDGSAPDPALPSVLYR